jgi:hypothetical protein
MRPNTILLSTTTTRLQLDAEEGVPSFIAHHVQHIPLSPFLHLALITSNRQNFFDVDLFWIMAVLQNWCLLTITFINV